MESVIIRRVTRADQHRWVELFTAYRRFYDASPDPAAVARTWIWVAGEQHGLVGLVAVAAQGAPEILGLANLRTFARPVAGELGLYLDDLFTDPAARRMGVGAALIGAAADLAAQRGASVVRWITADTNTAARSLYDKHATAAPWVTYDMAPRSLA